MKKPNFAAMNPAVAKAIEQMMVEQGEKFSLEKINLADLGRRTGISRAKLRSMKSHRPSAQQDERDEICREFRPCPFVPGERHMPESWPFLSKVCISYLSALPPILQTYLPSCQQEYHQLYKE